MVQRLQPRQIVAIDLDGTLISANSLHLYIIAALKHLPVKKRIKIALLLAKRLVKLSSHRQMKFAVLDVIKPYAEDVSLKKSFINSVKSRLRPSVIELLDRFTRDGATLLLATAAADIYIPLIWEHHYIATPTLNNPHKTECRGVNKADAVKKFMKADDTLLAVITDHHDDLALLSLNAKTNYLVCPSQQTLTAVNCCHIPYTLLR